MTAERIYLDHAATTAVRPEVRDVMLAALGDAPYNPSSPHAEGRAARRVLDEARDVVARVLGVNRREIIFTGSGSEADNIALLGAARANRSRGRHIVSTIIEHHAVLHTLDALRDDGFEITLLPVDERGVLPLPTFAGALRSDTILASVMYANNEIGVVQAIPELAAIARERGVLFHTDAVQAPGYLTIDVPSLGVDMLALAAHKFYGPKGVGALYVRTGAAVEPVIHGGGQERGLRSGTENVAGVAGLARALELIDAERSELAVRVGALRDALEDELQERLGALVRVNGAGAPRLANNANLTFAGIDPDQLLMALDLAGLAISTGSACTSGIIEPSHVIAALSGEAAAGAVIRFTLGRETTKAEIDRAVETVAAAVSALRDRTLLQT